MNEQSCHKAPDFLLKGHYSFPDSYLIAEMQFKYRSLSHDTAERQWKSKYYTEKGRRPKQYHKWPNTCHKLSKFVKRLQKNDAGKVRHVTAVIWPFSLSSHLTGKVGWRCLIWLPLYSQLDSACQGCIVLIMAMAGSPLSWTRQGRAALLAKIDM